jgi:hypothetical protein
MHILCGLRQISVVELRLVYVARETKNMAELSKFNLILLGIYQNSDFTSAFKFMYIPFQTWLATPKSQALLA